MLGFFIGDVGCDSFGILSSNKKMPTVRHFSRIDTFELKLKIERKLGSQKAQKYFNLLTRFLSLNIKKSEFDKLCLSLIGRENLRLHNELIKSIVKNAIVSKTPPPKQVSKISNGPHPISTLQSVFPQSPKKVRTPNLRERKFRDRPSPLGLHEKTQEQQVFSLGSKPPIEVNSVEEGEEVEQNAISPGIHRRNPITPPFGIILHSKETRKILSSGFDSRHYTETCHYNGQLPPTSVLTNRLKQKLKMDGLDVSTDCVNLLNNGLDCFLKSIIKPSLELAGSRSSRNPNGSCLLSMLDLRVASETNPKILGDHWPVFLEKVRLFDFEKSTGMQTVENTIFFG